MAVSKPRWRFGASRPPRSASCGGVPTTDGSMDLLVGPSSPLTKPARSQKEDGRRTSRRAHGRAAPALADRARSGARAAAPGRKPREPRAGHARAPVRRSRTRPRFARPRRAGRVTTKRPGMSSSSSVTSSPTPFNAPPHRPQASAGESACSSRGRLSGSGLRFGLVFGRDVSPLGAASSADATPISLAHRSRANGEQGLALEGRLELLQGLGPGPEPVTAMDRPARARASRSGAPGTSPARSARPPSRGARPGRRGAMRRPSPFPISYPSGGRTGLPRRHILRIMLNSCPATSGRQVRCGARRSMPSSSVASCAGARPLNPFSMSVTPAASKTLVVAGTGIIGRGPSAASRARRHPACPRSPPARRMAGRSRRGPALPRHCPLAALQDRHR